jgi:hypothetical protein
MALSVACPCGANFEVADTFAGQSVACPECQRPVTVRLPRRAPPRTSGYALTSVILSLVGAFTIILTVLAIAFGLIALLSIGRHRDQVKGTGYAVFGIVAGALFTALTLFAFSKGELFGVGEHFREQFLGGEVTRGGPLEILDEKEGFAITRPSENWGVARRQMTDRLDPDCRVMLANLRQDAYLKVNVEKLDRGQTLNQFREELLTRYRNQPGRGPAKGAQPAHFVMRKITVLPVADGLERTEVIFELRFAGQLMTYLVRIVRPERGDRVYIVSGWSYRRRFTKVEPDLRQTLDSFRLLKP